MSGNNSIFSREKYRNQQCEQICYFSDRDLYVNMNVHGSMYLCMVCAPALLCSIYMKEEITAGFQTRLLLPELQRKLNESGCKMYSLFDFHLLTAATESHTITGSAQVPLAHGYKSTITLAYHFNADVPGRSLLWRQSDAEYIKSVRIEARVYCLFFLVSITAT